MIDSIVKSIAGTSVSCSSIDSLPDSQGLYGFSLKKHSELGRFGSGGQVIYAGLASMSLNGRDLQTHLTSGKSGWSSFRRSLGAILKQELNLVATKRDKNPKKLRADKYRFQDDGEERLTDWMLKNLNMGYWASSEKLTTKKLRKLEFDLLLTLSPTLDLDRRTSCHNQVRSELNALRKICRDEVVATG